MRSPSFRYATGNTLCFVLRYELFGTVRLQSNRAATFKSNICSVDAVSEAIIHDILTSSCNMNIGKTNIMGKQLYNQS